MYSYMERSHACFGLDSGLMALRYRGRETPAAVLHSQTNTGNFNGGWKLRMAVVEAASRCRQPIRHWRPILLFSVGSKGHFNLKTRVFQILTYILNLQLPLTFQLTSLISGEPRLSLRVCRCLCVWQVNRPTYLIVLAHFVILINLPITARLILIQTTAEILAVNKYICFLFFRGHIACTCFAQSRKHTRVIC